MQNYNNKIIEEYSMNTLQLKTYKSAETVNSLKLSVLEKMKISQKNNCRKMVLLAESLNVGQQSRQNMIWIIEARSEKNASIFCNNLITLVSRHQFTGRITYVINQTSKGYVISILTQNFIFNLTNVEKFSLKLFETAMKYGCYFDRWEIERVKDGFQNSINPLINFYKKFFTIKKERIKK
jgi:hypothetical protein